MEVFIEDNGAPHNGTPVDRAAFGPPQPARVFGLTAASCDDPTVANYQPLNSGNYTVRR